MSKYLIFLCENKGRRINGDPELEKKIPFNIFSILTLNKRNKDIIDHPDIYDILRNAFVYNDNVLLKRFILSELIATIK
jgi:hypothetical protein